MAQLVQRLNNSSAGGLKLGKRFTRRRWFAGTEPTSARHRKNGCASAKRTLAIIENPTSCHISHSGISRSMDYLAKHWRESIGVMDLVRISRMSRRGFLKAFSKHTGDTPGRRLRLIRLAKAQESLLQSDSRLAVVALSCGFQSVNSFIIAFKRHVGLAPIQYRTHAMRRAFVANSTPRPTHNIKHFLHKA